MKADECRGAYLVDGGTAGPVAVTKAARSSKLGVMETRMRWDEGAWRRVVGKYLD